MHYCVVLVGWWEVSLVGMCQAFEAPRARPCQRWTSHAVAFVVAIVGFVLCTCIGALFACVRSARSADRHIRGWAFGSTNFARAIQSYMRRLGLRSASASMVDVGSRPEGVSAVLVIPKRLIHQPDRWSRIRRAPTGFLFL